MGMQATSKGTMPVVLLKEGGSETKGRDAQKNNIAAYSSSLHNLVLALELSGTVMFPYNIEAILLEQEIEGEK